MFLTHALRAIRRAAVVTADAFWNRVTLLLTGAPQVSTFITDASTNNFQLTSFGDTRPNNFNPYTPGYYSNYFDGTGDYLSASGTASNFGTGDFTMEAWFYKTGTTSIIVSNQDGGLDNNYYTLDAVNSGVIFQMRDTGGQSYAYGSAIVDNTWTHIAVSRSSGSVRVFVNGVSGTPVTITKSVTQRTTLIGGFLYTGYETSFTGFISNVRIVKGTAVYTANFTPSTVPLTAIANTSLLTCQANRFIDSSTNNFAITRNGDVSISPFDPFVLSPTFRTYGSTFFDGTGDYLTAPSSAAFGFGTGDFTVECWVNTSTINTVIFDTRTAGTDSGVFFIQSTTGFIGYFDTAVGSISGTSNVANGAWNHLAWTRSGTTFRMFVNGVQQYSGTNSGNFGTTRPAVIGSAYVPGSYFSGYISDLRFIKGTAVYTANFTPPTAPLTAVANTSLLTLQTNQPVSNSTFLDNSSLGNLITRNGNATQGSYSPYGGNWSNYFDGTSSLNTTSAVANFLCTGSATGITATLEAWVYITAYSTGGSAWLFSPIFAKGATYLNFGIRNGAVRLYWYDGAAKSVDSTSTSDVPLNKWTHIAVTISGATVKIFVDGILNTTSATYTGVQTAGSGTNSYIAYEGSGTLFTGYISNFRLSTSVVYASSFTPSTSPLTPTAGTSLLTCADNRIIDDSPSNFAITRNGDVSVQRFSPFSPVSSLPVSYGAYFDGTGDYLTVPSNAAFGYSTGDFTLEFWVNFTDVTALQTVVSNLTSASSVNPHIYYSGNNGLRYYTNSVDRITGSALSASTWYHIALCRSSGSTRMFVNGVQSGATYTDANNYGTSAPLGVGTYWAAGSPFTTSTLNGHISNLRIVNGTAVYTSAFTPPTLPLTAIANTSLLTCQSPSLIDNSTNNFTITRNGDARPVTQNPFGFTNALTTGYDVTTVSGSAYFDGTGDYLTVPYSSNFFLQNSYTIEAWVNPANVSTWKPIFTITAANVGSFGYLALSLGNAAASAEVRPTTGGSISSITGGTIVPNVWHHIALSVNSTSARLFLNGVQVGSTTTFPNFSFTPVGVAVGVNANLFGISTDIFNGYISDLRIIKGTALYTGPFVPPVAPLTAVQNTVLLNNFTNAGVYDASMLSDLETVGDARVSTAVSKYSGSSLFFDGTGDYLTIPHDPVFNFGTGDFTIECWAYFNNLSNSPQIIQKLSSNLGWFFEVGPNTIYFGFGASNASQYYQLTGITLTTGVWYHLAATRVGSVLSIFLNGVKYSSTVTNANASYDNLTPFIVGSYRPTSTAFDLNGYIDDLRVTKGVARYTANFTPPTAALPTF